MNQVENAEGVIVLGGDGTILTVTPLVAKFGIPVFGVNVGRLGFLTACDFKNLYRSLEMWLDEKWALSERMLIEVTAPGVKTPQIALNEAVVRLKSSFRVTTIHVSVNDETLAMFVGDGVIISTTTGSTAYSLSAQGPVVYPEIEAMILTPICPHSFSQRPLVFPSHYDVELHLADEPRKDEIQLCLDGQRVFSLKCGDRVRVRRSPHKLKLVQNPQTSFFGVLREKLHWGGR